MASLLIFAGTTLGYEPIVEKCPQESGCGCDHPNERLKTTLKVSRGEMASPMYRMELPQTGRILCFRKFRNALGKTDIYAEDQSGNIIDLEKAIDTENLALRVRRGNWSEDVEAFMANPNIDSVNVFIWLKDHVIREVEKLVSGNSEELKKWEKKHIDRQSELKRHRKVNTQDVLGRIGRNSLKIDSLYLENSIQQGAQLFESAPFFMSRVGRGQLNVLKHYKLVASISIANDENEQYDLADAAWYMNVDLLHESGNGTGVKTGVWHPGYPNFTSQLGSPTYRVGSGTSDQHLAYMITSIRNNRTIPTNGTGFAPGANLYVANYGSSSQRHQAFDWAINQGLRVLNQSWHMPTQETSGSADFDDRKGDYFARNYPFTLLVQAAGNLDVVNEFVNHKGYNNLVVGQDLQTNMVEPNSVTRNPSSGQELPHVTAGVDHSMNMFEDALGNSVITANGASSVAAAVMTGFAASVIAVHPSLADKPEAVRAIIMTSAWNVTDNTWWADRYVDGHDGAGRPDGYSAKEMALRQGSEGIPAGTSGWIHSDFNFIHTSPEYRQSVAVGFGGILTVGLSWFADVSGANFENVKLPDLDLEVYRDGVFVEGSYQVPDPIEMLHLTNLAPGTYEIRVLNYSLNGAPNVFFGLAWMSY